MAIQKTSYRSYWVIGSGVLFIVSVIWFLIERNRNEKLADAIMKIAGSSNDPVTDPNSAKFGDSRDLGISKIMSPSSISTANPSRITIWNKNADGSDGPAFKLAKQIYAANSNIPFNDNPGSVVDAFRSLKTKEDVSKLADSFHALYKTDLYTFLNGTWLTHDCSPEQDTCFGGVYTNYLKQIYDIIKNLQ